MAIPGPYKPCDPRHPVTLLWRDGRGSALVEAAFALPLLIAMLLGILVYGSWFMAAHMIQQAANDAARSALAGLSETERRALVDQSVAASLGGSTLLSSARLHTATSFANGYYSVRLSYDLRTDPLFAAVPLPTPAPEITREAVVRMEAR